MQAQDVGADQVLQPIIRIIRSAVGRQRVGRVPAGVGVPPEVGRRRDGRVAVGLEEVGGRQEGRGEEAGEEGRVAHGDEARKPAAAVM